MSQSDLQRRVERFDVNLTRLRHQVSERLTNSSAAGLFLQIIQGQTIATGQYGITYSASLSLTQVYDPDVDTVYPAGLGNAWLWSDGVRLERVLVRHDASDYQTPLLAGVRRRVLDTVTLTYSGTDMLAYRHTWE